MTPKIERLTEGAILGEGPHWDQYTKSLYFVDIVGKTLNKYVPATKKHTKVSIAPLQSSFIIPVKDKENHFVASLNNELAIITWDGVSDKTSIVEKLPSPPTTPETANNNFNDGKCDNFGRLWAGNLCLNMADLKASKPVGTLYSLGRDKQLKSHFSNIRIANGLAWNDSNTKMFYIDSLKEVVDQYDFDPSTATLSNPQILFTFKKHNVPGIPDGMTIDADGKLWVACFGGGRVIKIDSEEPETLLDTVELPAEQITSVAFGGKNLDEMYVTSGAVPQDGRQFPAPINGATYRVTGMGARGLPGVEFDLTDI